MMILLTPKQAAEYLHFSEATLQGLRSRGGGPAFLKPRHAVRYRQADLDDWLLAGGRLSRTRRERESAAQ